jgi:hypothetical protein
VLGVAVAILLLDKILTKEDRVKRDKFFATYAGIDILVCTALGLFVGALLVLHTYLIS